MQLRRLSTLFLGLVLCTATAWAGNDSLTMCLSTEAALSSGDFTSYYLTANRHGILSTRANTGYLRAAITDQKTYGKIDLTACADIQLQAHTDNSPIYLQQLYLNANWKWLDLCLGSKEIDPLLRDIRLSSGSFIWSGNARPIPGIYLGTHGYTDVPYTHHWVQFFIDGSFGYYMDTNYLEDEYEQYLVGKTGYGRSYITTNVWSHQKRISLRSNPQKRFVYTMCIEFAMQFGGKSTNYIDPDCCGDFSPSLNDFFTALIPHAGDSNATGGDQAFYYGNNIGDINALLEYQFGSTRNHRIGIYLEDPFEDGSGMRKGNGWDGLWGLEYHNSNPQAWLKGIVLEYLQTTDQSGPIHWAPQDYEGKEVATIAHGSSGSDDYYNNYFFTGYSHFGQACGTPMLKSPAYNADHYLRFTDNRVKAFHLGLNGHLWTRKSSPFKVFRPRCSGDRGGTGDREGLGYLLLFSHRTSYGTYFDPAPDKRHSTDFLLELNYRRGDWTFAPSFALDRGDLYGDNTSFALRISRLLNLKK